MSEPTAYGGFAHRLGRMTLVLMSEVTGYRRFRSSQGSTVWRNGRDSNPRGLRPAAFKAAAFVHSATVPVTRLPGYTPGLPGEVPERPNGAPC